MISPDVRLGWPQTIAAAAAALALSACAGLPSSGPTAHQIIAQAAPRKAPARFHVVDLDQAGVDALNAAPVAPTPQPHLASLADLAARAVIGPGDTLSINLYEVGVSLFAGSHATATGADAFDASAHGEELAAIPVDQNGYIRLPFAGSIRISGMTTGEVERIIERRLGDKSQNPQAVVSVTDAKYSSVVVTGDVRKPGRVTLTAGFERLTDAIAAVGGSETASDDIVLRFMRNGTRIEQRLGGIDAGSADDLVLDPGDRIDVLRVPRSFTVFGSTGRVSEVRFEAPRVTLAEALARTQGPNEASADPSGIFLFRLDAPPTADGSPVIYRISLLDARTYFLAQKLAMRDKDLIYIASARTNQPSKFVGIINQLFSPVIAVRTVAQ